ncbi:MAG: sigma-70 family RNA polymerase sigma factor [Candidatus Riflebacteria bacterium]|nr:sigma-70 family RNA polymerase sigma factor [Candidatus Riflebacteria bacterium]
MSDDLRQDGDLIGRILAGESGLFGLLVGKYERLVFSFLLPQVRNLQEVEDLAQETFLRAYSHLAGFDTGRKFSTWIVAIARNLLVDRYRKNCQAAAAQEAFQEVFASRGPLSTLGDPEHRAELHEEFRRTFQNILELPEDYKVPLLMRIMQDLSYDEIAEMLELPLQTVKNRIFKARKLLRAKRNATHDL